ncbi:GNAT family N-acetyltransferase [Brachybacterium hainanense]|uniref:GNAT family N-acetyltransferase n=1 Tax=Brachybacterium hainanense TaxID=1541174 RepID=A0ABV6RFS4_9MICO
MTPVTSGRSVRDLDVADLPRCTWAGSSLHLEDVARQLERARRGEVIYLLVLEDDLPVAIGGADPRQRPGEAHLWQLATDPSRQGEGFGSYLIAALEGAAGERGIARAVLGVEDDNPRALALYERLGYVRTGEIVPEEWDERGPDGRTYRHHAQVILLVKDLGAGETPA